MSDMIPPAGGPPPTAAPPNRLHSAEAYASLKRYWRSNVLLMSGLLLVWAVAGLGCGVVFADWLNQYTLGGYPLGFWFAQQGSIIVFVLVILVYCVAMNALDRKHHNELEAIKARNN